MKSAKLSISIENTVGIFDKLVPIISIGISITILLASFSSFAGSIGDLSGANSHAIFKIYDHLASHNGSVEALKLWEGLKNTCEDTDPQYSLNQNPVNTGVMAKIFLWNAEKLNYESGAILMHFSTLDGSSPLQAQYQKRLESIKRIRSSILRIKAAYELSTEFQPEYDYSAANGMMMEYGGVNLTSYTALLPGNIIENAKKGIRGQCRHMAALLFWTLNQVRKGYNSESLDGSDEFDVELVFDLISLPKRYFSPHVWIRIKMGPSKKIVFDLDPTNHKMVFSPLVPRYSDNRNSKERSEFFGICKSRDWPGKPKVN